MHRRRKERRLPRSRQRRLPTVSRQQSHSCYLGLDGAGVDKKIARLATGEGNRRTCDESGQPNTGPLDAVEAPAPPPSAPIETTTAATTATATTTIMTPRGPNELPTTAERSTPTSTPTLTKEKVSSIAECPGATPCPPSSSSPTTTTTTTTSPSSSCCTTTTLTVRFNKVVRVRLIPTRGDMARAGTLKDTSWSPAEFRAFRRDFLTRAGAAGLLPPPRPSTHSTSLQPGKKSGGAGGNGGGTCMLSVGREALLLTVADLEDGERADQDAVNDRAATDQGATSGIGGGKRSGRRHGTGGGRAAGKVNHQEAAGRGGRRGGGGGGGGGGRVVHAAREEHGKGGKSEGRSPADSVNAHAAKTPVTRMAAGAGATGAEVVGGANPWFGRDASDAAAAADENLLPRSSVDDLRRRSGRGRERLDVCAGAAEGWCAVWSWLVAPLDGCHLSSSEEGEEGRR